MRHLPHVIGARQGEPLERQPDMRREGDAEGHEEQGGERESLDHLARGRLPAQSRAAIGRMQAVIRGRTDSPNG